MGLGHAFDDVAGDVRTQVVAAGVDEAVTQPDQVIANVDGWSEPLAAMERIAPVAEQVVILNVIMHQRRLVEGFDRHRDAADRIAERLPDILDGIEVFAPRRRIKGGQRDERAEAFASIGQPVVGDMLREPQGRTGGFRRFAVDARQKTVKVFPKQPGRGPHRRQEAIRRRSRRRDMHGEDIVDPVAFKIVCGGVPSGQGHCVGGNAREHRVIECALEVFQCGQSQDGVDAPAEDAGHQFASRTGRENLIPQAAGALEDRCNRGWNLAVLLGMQKNAATEGDGDKGIPAVHVAEEHHDVAEIPVGLAAFAEDFAGQPLELLTGLDVAGAKAESMPLDGGSELFSDGGRFRKAGERTAG